MTLAEALAGLLPVGLKEAIVVGLVVALALSFFVTPKAIRKLRGAGITGKDRHKPGRPEVAEMGGLAVFVAFNAGVFSVLALASLSASHETLILASLVVAAGACITGVLDDLLSLRQRFKAFIPFIFAAPLALFVPHTEVFLPLVGAVEFGWLYPILLVPLAVACASNSFNMLEGFNGLGATMGIVTASAMALLCIVHGRYAGLALLFPMIGALGGFLWYNAYPAQVFPGDTMTLLVGAVLATAAIVSRIEFWAAILFLPQIVEFLLKAHNRFPSTGWGGDLREDGVLVCPPKRPVGLGQVLLKVTGGMPEYRLVGLFTAIQIGLAAVVVSIALTANI